MKKNWLKYSQVRQYLHEPEICFNSKKKNMIIAYVTQDIFSSQLIITGRQSDWPPVNCSSLDTSITGMGLYSSKGGLNLHLWSPRFLKSLSFHIILGNMKDQRLWLSHVIYNLLNKKRIIIIIISRRVVLRGSEYITQKKIKCFSSF